MNRREEANPQASSTGGVEEELISLRILDVSQGVAVAGKLCKGYVTGHH